MALLPDKEKLLRNFLRCANWEEKYLYNPVGSHCRMVNVYTDLHRSVLVSGEHKRHPTFQRESPANTGGLQ